MFDDDDHDPFRHDGDLAFAATVLGLVTIIFVLGAALGAYLW